MAKLQGLTVKECETACIHKQACKSVNTKHLKCTLVSKSSENPFDNVTLTSEADWTYRTTDYNEMNVSILSDETVSDKKCFSGNPAVKNAELQTFDVLMLSQYVS